MAEESVKPSTENDYVAEQHPQVTLLEIKIDPGLQDDAGNDLPRPFTKSQMRKWLKKVKWENRKSEKRAKEKARAKVRRQEARANNIDIGPSRKCLKKMKMERKKINIGIIIDVRFDHLMIEKNRYKVIKQILRCYSINRRSETPLKFHVANLGERTKLEMSRHNGYENWDMIRLIKEKPSIATVSSGDPSTSNNSAKKRELMEFHETSYLDKFPKEKLVYLTSESDNVIEQFEDDTYYIIGGLVDHNEHKGLCHSIACEQGLRHAQLPLDKYVNMKTRKVLTIDHVFEIVLRVCEGMSWENTLLKVLPLRKGASVSKSNNGSCDSLEMTSDTEKL